jgi:Methyltransferase domain
MSINTITSVGKIEFLTRKVLAVVRRPKLDRDKTNVLEEYSDGWRQYRVHLDQTSFLDQWLRIPGLEDGPGFYNVNGNLSYESFDSLNFYRQQLFGALRKYFPGARSITEFGAGIGRNLLFLKRELPNVEMYGYELCEPGIEVAKAAATKFGLNVQYAQLDYLSDPADKYIFPITDVAFTMFSLEQLPRRNEQAVRNILNHVRFGSIHLEPVPENYPFSIRGLLGRLDHWKVDYLSGFDRNVRGLGLKDVVIEPILSAHNPLMFPSLYILRKS